MVDDVPKPESTLPFGVASRKTAIISVFRIEAIRRVCCGAS